MKKKYMSFNELDNLDIINLFSYKPLNFKKDIDRDVINNNFKLLENNLDYKFKKIIGANQKHTNNVVVVDNDNINESFDGVDGLITNLKGVALVTYLADCQGILLYDKNKKIIGNIHSGWKGTLGRIIEKAINTMIDTFNSNVEDIIVCFCPSILKCCFEVDEEIMELFKNEFNDINIDECINRGQIVDNKQKYYIDTIKINKDILINIGIKEDNILCSNICSKCNSDFIHSYRADKPNDGRNIALICIK